MQVMAHNKKCSMESSKELEPTDSGAEIFKDGPVKNWRTGQTTEF